MYVSIACFLQFCLCFAVLWTEQITDAHRRTVAEDLALICAKKYVNIYNRIISCLISSVLLSSGKEKGKIIN